MEDAERDTGSIDAVHRNWLHRSRGVKRDAEPTLPGKRWGSSVLHRIGNASEHSATGLIAAGALLCWVAVGATTGFPSWWENVLYSVSSSVTVVMVFVLQHTQSRQQAVTQRKLDELLRALPSADNRLIALEVASDDELGTFADLSQANREQALEREAPHRTLGDN